MDERHVSGRVSRAARAAKAARGVATGDPCFLSTFRSPQPPGCEQLVLLPFRQGCAEHRYSVLLAAPPQADVGVFCAMGSPRHAMSTILVRLLRKLRQTESPSVCVGCMCTRVSRSTTVQGRERKRAGGGDKDLTVYIMPLDCSGTLRAASLFHTHFT